MAPATLQARGSRGGARAEVCRHDGPRKYLWSGAFFRRGQGKGHQADPRVRALRVQGGGSSRGDDERPVQPPAGAGRERRGLPESDPADIGGEPARVLPEAAGEQEVPCGTCEGADRFVGLPERRTVRGAGRREDGRRRPLPEGQSRGAAISKTSSAKGISSSRFRTRGWRKRERSARISTGWKRIWGFRWSRPTTRITCAAKTRTRTK